MHIESLSGVLLYLTAFLIIFSENGVFFLFFLPGDSLLFALGLLANQGTINIWYLIPLLIVAAICGNVLGYFLGQISRAGFEKGKYLPKVKPAHLEQAKRFYDKHGILAIFFARWVPVMRTIVPFFAGVAGMRTRVFRLWSILGGIAWIASVTLAGYFFGDTFNIDELGNLGIIVIGAAVVATPVFLAVLKRLFK
jgi:membrane-associated protein